LPLSSLSTAGSFGFTPAIQGDVRTWASGKISKLAWQSYGEAAKQMIARWAPRVASRACQRSLDAALTAENPKHLIAEQIVFGCSRDCLH